MDENIVSEEMTNVQEPGTVKISEEVVSTVASIAVTKIEGVSSMNGSIAGGLAELFGGKKSATKGIKVDIDGTNVYIDIHISVVYGYKIPEIAWQIQEKVKESVEDITGLNVEKVKIHVDGISMEKVKKDHTEPVSAEVPEEPSEEMTEDVPEEESEV